MTDGPGSPAHVARAYYDGPAAEVYRQVWEDNLHMGTWRTGDESFQDAMATTNHVMAERGGLTPGSRVLDAGCGYGAAARLLAREYDCTVIGVSVGEKELAIARERAEDEGLGERVAFRFGDYHDLPFGDAGFDFVWSQEAFLHAADKARVVREAFRVLKPDGRLVFSDLLLNPDVDDASRARILSRVHAPTMWDATRYERALADAGFTLVDEDDWRANVAPTYAHAVERLRAHRDALARGLGDAFVDETIAALSFWVSAARDGNVGQGFFVAEKPA